MSLVRRFAYNSVIQIIGKALSIILGLLSIALITRYLGVSGFGRYTALSNFLGIFAVLADLGLTMVTAQLINERPQERSQTLNSLFGFRLLSASLIIFIGLVMAWFLPYYQEFWLVLLILSFSYFFIAINQVLVGLLQSELRADYLMTAEVIGRLFWFIGLLLGQYFNWGLMGIAVVTGVSGLIHFTLAWWWSNRLIKIKPAYDRVLWQEIIQRSWPLAVTIVLNLIYLRADILFLSWLQGEGAVGLYGAAYKVIDVLTSLPFLVIGLLLPILTRAWAGHQQKYFNFLVKISLSGLLIVVLPAIVGGQLLADSIINLVAGSEFVLAGPVLAVLLIAIAGIFASCLFNHFLIAINRQRVMVRPYLIIAITAVPVYWWLIKYYSYWGAAIAAVYSELLVALFSAYYSKKILGWQWPWATSRRVVLATGTMAIIVWFLRAWASQGLVQLMFVVGLAILVYGLALIVFRVFDWRQGLSFICSNEPK